MNPAGFADVKDLKWMKINGFHTFRLLCVKMLESHSSLIFLRFVLPCW